MPKQKLKIQYDPETEQMIVNHRRVLFILDVRFITNNEILEPISSSSLQIGYGYEWAASCNQKTTSIDCEKKMESETE